MEFSPSASTLMESAPGVGVTSSDSTATPTADRGKLAEVFISYSRKDAGFAERLREKLEEERFDAYFDKRDIMPGEPWQERLAKLIETADTVVFLVSPDSIASQICDWEINEAERLGKRLLPVVVRQPDQDKIPGRLNRLHYIFLRDEAEWKNDFPQLVVALLTDIGWIREHTRLGELAARWKTRGAGTALVLRGQELVEAEGWLGQRPSSAPEPTAVHIDFIQASRKASTKRQRYWLLGSIAVTIITAILGVFAFVQKEEADTRRLEATANAALAERNAATADANAKQAEANAAEAKRSADLAKLNEARAVAQLKQAQRNESLTLAEQSLRETETGDALEGMRRALAALPADPANADRPYVQRAELALAKASLSNRLALALTPGQDNVNKAIYSSDGRIIATGSRDGILTLYEADSGQEIKSFTDGRGAILTLAFSFDGKRIATSHADPPSILVRDLNTGQVINDFDHLQSIAYQLFFTPDAGTLVSIGTSPDAQPRVWDLKTGRLSGILGGGSNGWGVRSAAISSSGEYLAATFYTDEVNGYIWSLKSRQLVFSNADLPLVLDNGTKPANDLNREEPEDIYAIKFVPGTDTAVFRGKRAIYVVDPINKAIERQWEFSDERNYAAPDILEISSDGKYVLLAPTQRELTLYELADGRLLASLKGHVSTIVRAAFDPGGQSVAAAAEDNTLRVWEASSGKQLQLLRGHTSRLFGLIYSKDGARLMSYGDPAVRIWDVRPDSDRLFETGPGLDWQIERVDQAGSSAIVVKPASPGDDPTANQPLAVGVWNLIQKRLVWETPISQPNDIRLDHSAFLAGGQTAAIWWQDGGLDLVNTTDGGVIHVDTGKAADDSTYVTDVAFAGDASMFAVTWSKYGDDSEESRTDTEVWRLNPRVKLLTISQIGLHQETIFGPDQSHLLLYTDPKNAPYGTVRVSLWSIVTGAKLAEIDRSMDDPGEETLLPINSDRLVLGGAEALPKLFGLSSGREVASIAGPQLGVQRIAWSGDGRYLLVKRDNSPWVLWDVAARKVLTELPSSDVSTAWLQLSDDARRLATWDPIDSKHIEVFDVQTGNRIKDLGAIEAVSEFYLGSTGSRVAVRTGPRSVQLYDIDGSPAPSHIQLSDGLRRWRFTGNEQRFVTADQSGTFQVWHAQTGALVADLTNVDANEPLGTGDPKQDRLAVLLADGKAVVIDTSTGEIVWSSSLVGATQLALSDDGKIVALALASTAEIYRVETGESVASVARSPGTLSTFQFDEAGRLLMLVANGSASLVDTKTGQILVRQEIANHALETAGTTPVLILSSGPQLSVYDAYSGALQNSYTLSADVESLRADSSGSTLAITTSDAKVTALDLAKGKLLSVATLRQKPTWVGFANTNGEMLIYEKSGQLSLREIASGRIITEFPGEWPNEVTGFERGWAARADPSGRYVAVRSPDNFVRIYRTKDGSLVSYFQWDNNTIADVAFSPRGGILLALTEDGRAGFWKTEEASSDHMVRLSGAFSKYNTKVRLSPGGYSAVAVDESGAVHMVSFNTYQAEIFSTGRPENGVVAALSRDESLLATLSASGIVRLWHVGLRQVMAEVSLGWTSDRSPFALRFSKDGRHLIVEPRFAKPQILTLPLSGNDLISATKNTVARLSPSSTSVESAKNTIDRGPLGIYITTPSSDDAERFKLPQLEGALITEVLRDSPAQEVGLKVGDLVVSINGKPIHSSTELSAAVRALNSEGDIDIVIFRDGARRQLKTSHAEPVE